jgi:hypothetical protein
MSGVLQRLGIGLVHHAPPPTSSQQTEAPCVLVITADTGFYSGVLHAACSNDWRIRWARTLGRAIEICKLEHTPVVVYDSNLPGAEWGWAFDLLNAIPYGRRILLASQSSNEELWMKVLDRRGYDVVPRSAGHEELARSMRFAWLSLFAQE